MPADDSPAILVARFLKANNYERTLTTFIAEANLPPDAGSLPNKDALTLENVLEEKKAFDKSLKYTKQGDATDNGWTPNAPAVPHVLDTLPTSSNMLHVSVEDILVDGAPRSHIVASAADRKVSMLSTGPNHDYLGILPPAPLDSPALSCLIVDQGMVVLTAMSGLVSMYNLRTHKQSERRDHKKYVVKAALWNDDEDCTLLATAGWDARVLLYRLTSEDMGEPVAEVSLQTNPETVLFVKDPGTGRLFLLVSRRDSTYIYYHLVNTHSAQARDTASSASSILTLAGRQNLAPHSTAWVAFSPSSMALCPTDPTLLGIATSSLPHMKVILVRLLFPAPDALDAQITYTNQADQAREELARQDREEAAIQVHVSTMAPQTPYSTPQICWRPDGSGVFVNGDDGTIRGVEAKTGQIMTMLREGHEPGSKIRSIWCGYVGEDRQEWLVSGGFDRRLVVWKPA